MTLRDMRTRAKLTQVELAAKAGLNQEVISRLECGKTLDPHYSVVAALANALGTSPTSVARAIRTAPKGVKEK